MCLFPFISFWMYMNQNGKMIMNWLVHTSGKIIKYAKLPMAKIERYFSSRESILENITIPYIAQQAKAITCGKNVESLKRAMMFMKLIDPIRNQP